MNKTEKAVEFAKARYRNNGSNGEETQNEIAEIAKMIACKVGYEAGWEEALKVNSSETESKPFDSKKTEFKIGEEFQFGLIKLKCMKEQGNDDPCQGCYFNDNFEPLCHSDIVGDCCKLDRKDKTGVIFVRVD